MCLKFIFTWCTQLSVCQHYLEWGNLIYFETGDQIGLYRYRYYLENWWWFVYMPTCILNWNIFMLDAIVIRWKQHFYQSQTLSGFNSIIGIVVFGWIFKRVGYIGSWTDSMTHSTNRGINIKQWNNNRGNPCYLESTKKTKGS